LEPGTNHLLRTLSIAVHEFRTPVTVVAGYLRMLLREQGGPLTDKQRKMLEETERSCGRLSALVNEMSELVKLDSHALTIARQDVDVAELVAGLAGDVREGSDRGVGLEVRANGPLVIAGDRPRLSAALTALMHAAVRERGEPGTIVIDCSTRHEDSAWAIVAIGDAPAIERLRDARPQGPQYDEWQAGLGLALPLARRTIEAHGGTLWSDPLSRSRAAAGLRLPLRA
jgi:two-component system cell cycle sensor histidine kinase PleC